MLPAYPIGDTATLILIFSRQETIAIFPPNQATKSLQWGKQKLCTTPAVSRHQEETQMRSYRCLPSKDQLEILTKLGILLMEGWPCVCHTVKGLFRFCFCGSKWRAVWILKVCPIDDRKQCVWGAAGVLHFRFLNRCAYPVLPLLYIVTVFHTNTLIWLYLVLFFAVRSVLPQCAAGFVADLFHVRFVPNHLAGQQHLPCGLFDNWMQLWSTSIESCFTHSPKCCLEKPPLW